MTAKEDMPMKKSENRQRFTAEEKVSMLRRHLLEGVAVSDLGDEYGRNPPVC